MNIIYNEDVFKTLDRITDKSIDLVLCDPPYGVSIQAHSATKDILKPIAGDNNLDFLPKYCEECFRILKDDSALYMFCSWQHVDIFKQNIEKYFKVKSMIIWVKPFGGLGNFDTTYSPQYEICFFAVKPNSKFRFHNEKTTMYPDVVYYERQLRSEVMHVSPKPIPLLQHFIENSSKRGDLVYDGFMGSGSTAVAAKEIGRNFIGSEIDESHWKTCNDRIAKVIVKVDPMELFD